MFSCLSQCRNVGESGNDASGRVLKVKLVNVGRVPGIRRQELSFSDSGSYFDYGDSPRLSFNAKAPFTMAFWVQTRGWAGANRSLATAGCAQKLTLLAGACRFGI